MPTDRLEPPSTPTPGTCLCVLVIILDCLDRFAVERAEKHRFNQ
jgi:hypothetical protein